MPRFNKNTVLSNRTTQFRIFMKVTISKLFIFSLLAMAIKSAHSAAALPTGEKIIHGEVSISRGPNSMFISSNTDRNVISWNDFSVAKGNSVVFSGTDATFLNIVKAAISQLSTAMYIL